LISLPRQRFELTKGASPLRHHFSVLAHHERLSGLWPTHHIMNNQFKSNPGCMSPRQSHFFGPSGSGYVDYPFLSESKTIELRAFLTHVYGHPVISPLTIC
jgi:hypothetical protein